MARLTLTLLGGFEARLAGRAPLVLPKKTQALLAYLALSARPTSRVELATLLWGDTGRAQAQGSLRQTLSVFRQSADPSGRLLVADARTVTLDPGATEVDAVRFEALVRKGGPEALTQATALYRGDLLAGLELDEAPFEEWLLAQRERLRELAMNGLMQLLAHQSGRRAYDDAVVTASRLLALDPLHEPAHCALMRVFLAQGRRPAALRQYQSCVAALQRELGVEPASETKQAYAEILREPVSRASGGVRTGAPARARDRERLMVTATAAPFVGRERERLRLREAMASAFEGDARIVAVSGEAGIGKTRLLRHLAGEAATGGARVLVGRAFRAEQILPLGPWRDALRESNVLDDADAVGRLTATARAELGRLMPEQRADAPVGRADAPVGDDPSGLFDAMVALLGTLAQSQPLVLCIEDLQWADDMTLRLLAFVGRRLRARPLLVVVTVRDEDLDDAPGVPKLLDDLDRDCHLTRLPLQALSRDETSELVSALARVADASSLRGLAEQVWATSEGHPFMAVETIRALEEGSTSGASASLPLPERVKQVVSARLERLGEAGWTLLGAGAVIGRDFEFALLQRAAQLDDAPAAAGVEELVRRRVLRVVGERFEFTHDRIREVAYDRLLPPRRKLLHRQTAEALRALYSPALEVHYAVLGSHAHEAEQWEDAAEWFRLAGESALARSANREAVACFERAVAAHDRAPGRAETKPLAIDLRLRLRFALVLLGEVQRAFPPLEEARRLAESLGDRSRLGRVWAHLSNHSWWTGQPDKAWELAETAAQVADETSDLALAHTAAVCRGYARHGMGDARGVVEILGPLEDEDQASQRLIPFVSLRHQFIQSLGLCGEFEEARTQGLAAIARAEALGHRHTLGHACWTLAEVHLTAGAVPPAIALLERARGLIADRGDFFLESIVLGSLGYAHVLEGRVDDGLRLMHQALGGREPKAWRVGLGRVLVRLAESHVIAGRFAEARDIVERCLDLARGHGERGYEAAALRLLGEIALRDASSDGIDAAAEHFRHAIARATELGQRPLVARCHAGLGRLHRRKRRRAKAEEHAALAESMCRAMGMSGSAAG